MDRGVIKTKEPGARTFGMPKEKIVSTRKQKERSANGESLPRYFRRAHAAEDAGPDVNKM